MAGLIQAVPKPTLVALDAFSWLGCDNELGDLAVAIAGAGPSSVPIICQHGRKALLGRWVSSEVAAGLPPPCPLTCTSPVLGACGHCWRGHPCPMVWGDQSPTLTPLQGHALCLAGSLGWHQGWGSAQPMGCSALGPCVSRSPR